MLAFYENHPLYKEAALRTPYSKAIAKQMNAAADWASKQLASTKIMAKNLPSTVAKNKGAVAASAVGLGGGAYLGNNAHEQQVPPVRALPKLNAEEFILPDTQQLNGAY